MELGADTRSGVSWKLQATYSHVLTSKVLALDSKETRTADRVPGVYIKNMEDHVLKPELEDAMIKRWPPSQVFVLHSDHIPFFSTPILLFGLLVKASTSIKCA
ncbi:hypothetical protein ACFX2F_005835 [Malus domestica]